MPISFEAPPKEISFDIADAVESDATVFNRAQGLAASFATPTQISLDMGDVLADQSKQDFSISMADASFQDPQQDLIDMSEKAKKIAVSKGWVGKYIPEERLTVGSKEYSSDAVRYIINRQDAVDMIQEKMKELDESDRSWANRFLTSFDQIFIRGFLLGTPEALTYRSERLGQETAGQFKTLEPGQEFRDWFAQRIEEAAKEGVFSENSVEAMERLLQEATNAGFDRYADVNAALAAFDVLTVASPFISKAGSKFFKKATTYSEEFAPSVKPSGTTEPQPPALRDVEVIEPEVMPRQDVGPAMRDAEFTEVVPPKRLTGPEGARIEGPKPKQLTDQYADAIDAEYSVVDPNARRLTGPDTIDDVTREAARSARTNGVVSRVASVSNSSEAASAYERLRITNSADEIAQSEANVASFDPTSPLISGTYRANASMVNRALRDNYLLRELDEYFKRDGINRVTSEETRTELAKAIRERMEKQVGSPVIRQSEVKWDDLGLNPTVTYSLGDDAGELLSKEQAESLAEYIRNTRGVAAYAEPDNPLKPNGPWVASVDMPIDQIKGIPELDITEPWKALTSMGVRKHLASIFGSNYQLDDLSLNALANWSEGTRGKLRSLLNPMVKKIRKLPYANRVAINQVLRKLRDDPKLNYRKSWWSEFEFKIEYKKAHPNKKTATNADYDAYMAAVTVSDVVYTIRASMLLDVHRRLGNKTIILKNGDAALARVVKDINPDTPVLDIKTGKNIRASDISDEVIWESFDPGLEKSYYINPKNVKEPQYWDALDYNSGGPRFNPEANHFVVLWNGKDSPRSGRAILTAATKQQADKAVEELQNIQKVIAGRNLADIPESEILDIIRKNNTFEPKITRLEHLIAWSQRHKFDWTKEITQKKRGDKVEAQNDVFDSLSNEDYYLATAKRGDVLPQFGGGNTFNEDPISSIFRNFDSAASEYSWFRYNQRSKVGWLKLRLGAGYANALVGKSVNQVFEEELSKVPWGTKSAKDRRLREIGDIIKRRDFERSPRQEWLEGIAEYIYEFTFGKPMPTLDLRNPVDAAMNFNFKTFFMFNPSQFLMQTAHISNIMAVSPYYGPIGTSLVSVIRPALHAPNLSIRRNMLKGVAQQVGLKEKDIDELLQYIHDTQRTLVENDTIYRATSMSTGFASPSSSYSPTMFGKSLYHTSNLARKGLDAGMKPFNEGEIISRLAGITTAFLEVKAKNPNLSILTGEGKDLLSTREISIYGFSMNRANAGFLQQEGFRKIPSQFLSYPFRAMESVAFGRGLTKTQRARLGANLILMGGLGGAGWSMAGNAIAEHFGINPESPAFVFLQYGYYDAIASWAFSGLTGEELNTALGKRLSIIGAFVDLQKKIVEGSFLEVALGPTGSVVEGLFGSTGGALSSFFDIVRGTDTGSTDLLLQNMESLLRTPTAVNNAVKGANILMNGKYINKLGNELPIDFSIGQGILEGVGINTFKRQYMQDTVGAQIENFKEVDAFVKKYKPMMAQMRRYFEDKDYASAKALQDQIYAAADADLGLPNMRNMALKKLMEDPENQWYRSMLYSSSPVVREYFSKGVE